MPTARDDAERALVQILAERERFRDHYARTRDPIAADRLLWRAQGFRHLVHLLPGQSVLELGSGEGLFLAQLRQITRGRNPITSVAFTPDAGTGTGNGADAANDLAGIE